MYQTQLEYTYGEYRKMQRRVYEANIILQLIAIAVVTPLIILLLKNIGSIAPYAVAIIAGVVIIKYIVRLVDKKGEGWKLGSKENTDTYQYTFFEDYFEVKTERRTYKVNYQDLLKIIETKTHFYLKYEKYGAFILKKENCDDELIQFIRKYKR